MAQALNTRSIQGEQLDARTDRLVNELFAEGAAEANDFKVAAQGTPNMTVRAGSGVAGDIYVVPTGRPGGTYIVRNPDPYVGNANTDVSIANGGAQPRIDLVVLQVYDDDVDGSGQTVALVEVEQGTPAASPVAPAVPSGAVALAQVSVAAGLSSGITAGMITDRRVMSHGWISHTPVIPGVTIGNGSISARYKRTGNIVRYQGKVTLGSTSVLSQASARLPVTPHASADGIPGSAVYFDASAGRRYVGVCEVDTSAPATLYFVQQTAGTGGTGDVGSLDPFSWANGDYYAWDVEYEAA